MVNIKDSKTISSSKKQLKIAYVIQNVGGINFDSDIGDTVPVKHTLRGLHQANHHISCFSLEGSSVLGFNDVTNLEEYWQVQVGLSNSRPFRLVERAVRRLQRTTRLPYFAFFDTYRFYEVCCRFLPGYDVCHEHNGLFCVGAALASVRLGIPYILTFSADPLFERKLVGKPLRGIHALVATWEARLTYKIAKRIICVSNQAKQHLIDQWQVDPNKIVVMANGVDLNLFGLDHDPRPVRNEMALNGDPIVSFVGGFQPWHGLDRLAESFVRVLSEVPQAKLLLVGDGPARPAVEQKIAELGIQSSVIITGLMPQSRVPEMLSTADITVLPYPQMPKDLWFSPLKLYEYMAAGKAIVASRSGQIAEVIQDGHNGILVEAGNIADLSEAIIKLLKNPKERRRLGQNAREQAIKQHSWEQYIKRLEDIYRSVLKKNDDQRHTDQ